MNILFKERLYNRASKPNSSIPRPFLRWAGSKRLVLKHIIDILPDNFHTYYEPFLGSGSLYFLLCPPKAYIGDMCKELIDSFIAIRDDVNAVKRYLIKLKPNRELYYNIRDNRSSKKYEKAAEFIFLNKTCWNGLYRVNSNGIFNVPYGMPKSNTIFDESNLLHCSNLLKNNDISIIHSDFSTLVENADKGDLIFFDPPYVTQHTNNGFRDYNESLFSWDDQVRLAELAMKLSRRGAFVIVCNSHHPTIKKLYKKFRCKVFTRNSTIATDAYNRRTVQEAIFISN